MDVLMDLATLKKRYGIGLTGGIATGKTTISDMIADAGYHVYDADRIAREVVAPGTEGLQAVVQAFGGEILTSDGTLDRQKLGRLVFADERQRQTLEKITHPLIHKKLAEMLDYDGLFTQPRLWVYEAALLFETNTQEHFFQVWVTFCSEETQKSRMLQRPGMDEEKAAHILKSQLPGEEKAALADYAIDTDAPLERVREQVLLLLREADALMQKGPTA